MMRVLYVLRLGKRHILGQSDTNSEDIKPVVISIFGVRINWLVGQHNIVLKRLPLIT